jgi:hypothetical protein
MSAVEIRIASTGSERAERFLATFGARAGTGVRRALRRSLAGMRTDAYEAAKQEYNIRLADVRKAFTSRIWGNPPVGQATFSGGKIPLIRFAPRPAGVTRRRPPGGVSVVVKAQRKAIAGSFVARMRSGHLGVFQRYAKERLPIEEKFGPALAQMLDNPEVRERIEQRAAERFEKNLEHEIAFAVKQGGR